MANAEFVHLRVRSEYSVGHSTVRMNELVRKTAELNMAAVAVTDHGNIDGAIELYRAATAAGVKPIIGCEIPLVAKESTVASSLALLVADERGYRNLVKIVTGRSEAAAPHEISPITLEELTKHSAGLVALSGAATGTTDGDDMNAARGMTATLRDLFGRENLFLETRNEGIAGQHQTNSAIASLASEFRLRIVAVNNVRFLERSHHTAHDVLRCITSGEKVSDPSRRRYSPECYFKSTEEMAALFARQPGVIRSSKLIADRCNLRLDLGTLRYPAFEVPEDEDARAFLRRLCEEGLVQRFGAAAATASDVANRLEHELSIVASGSLALADYLLRMWDIARTARASGVPVGPGRGPTAGSLIAYLLGITEVDPLKFGLLAEPFFEPGIKRGLQIQLDIGSDGRRIVLDHVRRQTPNRFVAGVAHMRRNTAAELIVEIGTALELPTEIITGFASEIAKRLGCRTSLADAPQHVAELLCGNVTWKTLWTTAVALEGLPRCTTPHLAAYVVAEKDAIQLVPMTKSGVASLSRYERGALDTLGFAIVDLVEMRTLTVLQHAERLVRERRPDFTLADQPLDDEETFELIRRGETSGIFQLESACATQRARDTAPRSVEDLIRLIAGLYCEVTRQFAHPGPTAHGQPASTRHPIVSDVCATTDGVILYQEQLIIIVARLTGFSLRQANVFRRALLRADTAELVEHRHEFINACRRRHGLAQAEADSLLNLLRSVSGSAVLKSHVAAYALISYRMAFLKAHHSAALRAALHEPLIR